MQYLQMLFFKGRLESILCTLFSSLLGEKRTEIMQMNLFIISI